MIEFQARDRAVKQLLRLDEWADRAGVLDVLSRAATRKLTVLMYHRVLPDRLAASYPLANLVVRESIFRSQMRWLASSTHVVPLGEALRARRHLGSQGMPVVSVTFDDGYQDNCDVAAPVMEEHGLRGTFFVATDFVEGTGTLWFDEAGFAFGQLGAARCTELLRPTRSFTDLGSILSWLKTRGHEGRALALADLRAHTSALPRGLVYDAMSPAQVRGLHESGHEVGSHSRTHSILTQLSPSQVADELASSRERVAEWTGEAPIGFCYPNGNVDDVAARAVRCVGYGYACTTSRGVNTRGTDRYRLRRLMVAESSTSFPVGHHVDVLFAAEVFGLHWMLRRLRETVRRHRRGAETADPCEVSDRASKHQGASSGVAAAGSPHSPGAFDGA